MKSSFENEPVSSNAGKFMQPNNSNLSSVQVPKIELPRGGGAIKGIGEKFQVNAVTGTSSFSIPLPLSQTRQGFVPDIGLSYSSGSGNSPFGMGWKLDIASISRKTDDKLPEYRDEEDSDTFILSGVEDLVTLLEFQEGSWIKYKKIKNENGIDYTVTRYRPRIEGLFARIERWKDNGTGEVFWKTITSGNVHSYFGLTNESRIHDPGDAKKVFEWKLCRAHDDKGNIIVYKYKKEDSSEIPKKANEKNRIRNSQTYLKEVFYGNKQPYFLGDALPEDNNYMFRVVFDYGEHDQSLSIPKDIGLEKNKWLCRKDPFSTYRPGFEVRTYRRCSRILMFHCFDQEELPQSPYLVKSLQLFYDEETELLSTGERLKGFSFLAKARHNGHLFDEANNVYKTKSIPDIEIKYQQHEWNTEIKSITPDNLANAPIGLAGRNYLWIDLFNEGVSGILTEQADAWFYKSNLGDGKFSNASVIAEKPVFSGLSSGRVMIQELENNGIKYLVNYSEPKGFFKLNKENEWEEFKNFPELPNEGFSNTNMRPMDLNGDGLADFLITEENTIRWYPSLGEKGFEISQSVTKEIDEEKGPAILFADNTQSIFLADMNGDGLTDIVRIRNGEICYWPNLGYGRFGSKVSMDNAPVFDYPDSFNPDFLRLADIDGSGSIDIVYIGKNDFRAWMNLSGNEWSSEPQIISAFPQMDNLSDVAVLDLLGSGTGCIVYSSPISLHTFQFIDLTGGKKPHLLIGYQNNFGKQVTFEYKSSSLFYLEDKLKGNPWITKLPFPVHCVSKTITEDKIRKTITSCSYKYRHGYFDNEEKEFRGFARVEQYDSETFENFKLNESKNVVEEKLHQPPVKTISWFHTGAFLANKKIIHQCQDEYFKNLSIREYTIPEPVIAENITSEELREAHRALKGKPLRVETFSEDNSDKSNLPYSASEATYEIRLIQPKGENEHASFFVIPSESIAYSYDRNPSDPRISQIYSLETDEFGNPTKTSTVVYPRNKRPDDPVIPDIVWNEQNQLHVIYGESFYTNDIIEDDIYRLRASFESKTYDISGIVQPPGFFISKSVLKSSIESASEILFEQEFTTGIQKRLNGHSRIYFLNNDLTAPLSLGELSHLAILHSSCNLAFTKGLIEKIYDTKVTDQLLIDSKYIHSEGDDNWWAQSGTAIYSANPGKDFFMPVGSRDIFGNESFVEYDKYFLLIKSATDAIGNISSAVSDYRTLDPVLLTNPNLNRAAVETDELGLVIKSAIMGKEGSGEGDTLSDPTARIEYDLFNYQNSRLPNYAHIFAREKHGPTNPRFQENFVYSDGSGQVVMIKSQANPGKAKKWNPVTKQVEEVDADPRWIGNGRVVYNNKGNVIKQFEPYFSTTPEYESEDQLVETGVTPVIYYDPLGRKIKTEYPDGTFCRIEFDPWQFKSFDLNDTVKDSQWYIDRGSPDPDLIPEPSNPEQRAAWLSAKHYNTPSTFYTDSIGRPFITFADFGGGKTTFVQMKSDPVGRSARSFDQFNREISSGYNNMMGTPVYCKTTEKGEKWIFPDAMGRLVKIWNSFDREFRCTYDKVNRPVSSFLKDGNTEILYAHRVYGDLLPDAVNRNMKGLVYQFYDQGSVVTIQNYDFKGNGLLTETRITKEYKQATDWMMLDGITDIQTIEDLAEQKIESEIFTSSVVLDALNRPLSVTLPDNSVSEPKYNEANYLESFRVQIRGTGDFITFLSNQDYDAKGQRQFAKLGNGIITKYFY
ncbi:MAG: SpvB/TcaC N-terminal domain-containing protein, partial [Ignavibacteria bacterium]